MDAWARAGAVASLVVALDQATKAAALASVARGERLNVFFGLDIVNRRNTGVAFGVLSGGGALVVLLIAVAFTALLAYFAARAATPFLWLPVGMLLGGSLGNLADRAREGKVIDFIDPAFWPAFNLADAAVVLGVLGLLYVMEGAPGREPGAGAGSG